MNQILISEKVYVTPELKRKRKIYKINFLISIIVMVILISFYVYAAYDRDKNADLSQDILDSMNDDSKISSDDDVWIMIANSDGSDTDSGEEVTSSTSSATSASDSNGSTGTYKAANGKTYNMVGTISIPSINVNYPILSETTDALLKVSVCKFWGPDVNKVGNLCIAGHNYRNSKFFSKVPNLVVGDTVEVTDIDGNTVQYSVFDKYTVDPEDVSCTSQLTNGQKIVTLITCTNDSKQRVVVKAKAV